MLLHSVAVKREQSKTRRQLLEAGLWLAGSASLYLLGCEGTAPPRPAATPAPATPTPAPEPAAPSPGLIDEDLTVLRSPGGPATIVQRVPGKVTVLRKRARVVTDSDRASLALFENKMRETLEATDGGVGLAAPQIGVGARGILVMLDARGDSPRVEFFLNPRIIERSDEITADFEGCLSVRDMCGLVKRNRRVVVEHGLLGAGLRSFEVRDFDARIFQHEIDHLEGVLYVDRVDGEIHPRDKLKELREKLRQERPEIACTPVVRGRNRDEVLL